MTNIIKFKLDKAGGKLPVRKSPLDAGFDIHCQTLFNILPKERVLVKTGVYLADCPSGMYLRVAPRSKLANKLSIDVLAGVVDCNYRGEICVILLNTSNTMHAFYKGDAIAQLVPEMVMDVHVVSTDGELSATDRGMQGINDEDLRL